MFTGIVEELGTVKTLIKRGNAWFLTVCAKAVLAETKIGDSIAVNGCCLTVVKQGNDTLSFEVMAETARTTNLGKLRAADPVNLERSLKVGERVSGHFVSGHVDCLGVIRRKGMVRQNLEFQIAFPRGFSRYVVPKGSISVDGISLTIAEKLPDALSVYIIPHTLQNTTLAHKGPSDTVNLEFDMLAKQSPVSFR